MMAMANILSLIIAVFFGVAPCLGEEALRLPSFIGSSMVLQRHPLAPRIWGWTKVGHNVTAGLDRGAVLASSIADSDGSWSLELPPQPAGVGHSIEISDGDTTIQLVDIAFGDVYLCSGQSNMEFTVESAFNSSFEITDSKHYPFLRLATIDHNPALTPQDDVPSRLAWARSGPDAVKEYSATCYFFGKELYKSLDRNIPIGLVTSCWGGMPVETFSSPDALHDTTCGGTIPGNGFGGPELGYNNDDLVEATDSSSYIWNGTYSNR